MTSYKPPTEISTAKIEKKGHLDQGLQRLHKVGGVEFHAHGDGVSGQILVEVIQRPPGNQAWPEVPENHSLDEVGLGFTDTIVIGLLASFFSSTLVLLSTLSRFLCFTIKSIYPGRDHTWVKFLLRQDLSISSFWPRSLTLLGQAEPKIHRLV